MPPQPTPTMVLIIPLILHTLSAQQTTRPMANFSEFVYHIAEQPYDYLGSGSSAAWYLLSSSPIDSCRGYPGVVNATGSSLILLLLVSLHGRGDQPPHRRGSYTDVNHTIPWTSLPLEPGIHGVPLVPEELVYLYPIVLNISLHPSFRALSVSAPIRDQDVQHTYFTVYLSFGCLVDLNLNDLDVHLYTKLTELDSVPRSKIEEGHTIGDLSPSTSSRENESVYQSRKLLGIKDSARRQERIVTKAAIAVGLALFGLLCAIGIVLWCTRRTSKVLQTSGPRRYRQRELAAATRGFAEEEKIGRGGFGPVYRGYLSVQERYVAIKVLSQGSSVQGMKEFEAEVKVMTRIRHRNILQLLGWCDGSGGLLLVYEFMSNANLDKHLYDPQKLLTWSHRYKIALGVGYAILYLHTECDQCVVHGDIKPANILLDPSFNAKLGDFGLARLVDHGADSRTTQVVAGTAGYIDPEFVNSCRPSTESDVYSFGVVLLEIASGRRPTSTQSTGTPIVLLNWVRYMYRQNSILGAADRRLEREFDERQMRRVLTTGLWCTHRDRIKRPSIAQAMDVLRRDDAELPVLDPEMLSSSVRSLEENSNGYLSAEDSSYENWSAETAYHTSKDSTYLLAQE